MILDTSIFVDLLRTGRHDDKIDGIDGHLRTSSVVLAELLRGVKSRSESTFLSVLQRNHPLLTPTQNNWIESGELLGKMHIAHGFGLAKLRDLHFDVLIALTARQYGARLITSNRADFELIRTYREFDLEVW